MEKLLDKKQVVEETIKILSGIELPMVHWPALLAIHGAIDNLGVVVAMIEKEEEIRREKKNGEVNIENGDGD